MRKELMGVLCVLAGLALAGCAGRTLSSLAESREASSEHVTEDAPEELFTEDSTEEDTDTVYTVTELNIPKGDGALYGRLYVPAESRDSDERSSEGRTLVILSHGFGGSYRNVEDYAEYFAEHGIAAFAFDFTGGGSGTRSGGKTTEMSVLTEAEDLDTVLDYFKGDADFDRSCLFLLGESQGGFVSTYVAGTRPADVAGLVALYPAYVLQDDSREENPDPESGPEERSLMGVRIGRIYDRDAQSFDIYDIMKNYTGSVLIVHGTADSIAPVSYSERAADTFPDAELVELGGAGHGFYGSDAEKAAEDALEFVQEVLNGRSAEETDTPAASAAETSLQEDTKQQTAKTEDTQMTMTIGSEQVQVQWEDNDSVRALKELVQEGPLIIQMSMYGGFEQVGSLGQELPRQDVQTTTSAGDIVLYAGDRIVVFYGSNSWAYTRLGRITDKTADEMADLLGHGDVTITIAADAQ